MTLADGEPLLPVGVSPRPNGEDYIPRAIGGFEDVALIRDAVGRGEHPLLYGPPGTGKTGLSEAACFHWAQKDGDTFVHFGMESVVCSVGTTEDDFFGNWTQNPETGRYEWVPGPLHRAVMFGIPLYVDEIFLCDSRVLSAALYPVMDGRGVLRLPANPRAGIIIVNEGFAVIGSGNPDVPGAQFSDALRSRFMHHVEVTSDWSLARRLKVPNDVITVAKQLDRKRLAGLIDWSPQFRDLLIYRDTRNLRGQAFALSSLLAKAPFEDRVVMQEALSSTFNTTVHPLTMGSSGRNR